MMSSGSPRPPGRRWVGVVVSLAIAVALAVTGLVATASSAAAASSTSKASVVSTCKGTTVKTKSNKYETVTVKYSSAHGGTLCAKLKLAKKYRGLPYKNRRYAEILICLGHGNVCVKRSPLADSNGYFKTSSKGVQLTHVNGRKVTVYSFTESHNRPEDIGRPPWITLNFRGCHPIK